MTRAKPEEERRKRKRRLDDPSKCGPGVIRTYKREEKKEKEEAGPDKHFSWPEKPRASFPPPLSPGPIEKRRGQVGSSLSSTGGRKSWRGNALHYRVVKKKRKAPPDSWPTALTRREKKGGKKKKKEGDSGVAAPQRVMAKPAKRWCPPKKKKKKRKKVRRRPALHCRKERGREGKKTLAVARPSIRMRERPRKKKTPGDGRPSRGRGKKKKKKPVPGAVQQGGPKTPWGKLEGERLNPRGRSPVFFFCGREEKEKESPDHTNSTGRLPFSTHGRRGKRRERFRQCREDRKRPTRFSRSEKRKKREKGATAAKKKRGRYGRKAGFLQRPGYRVGGGREKKRGGNAREKFVPKVTPKNRTRGQITKPKGKGGGKKTNKPIF